MTTRILETPAGDVRIVDQVTFNVRLATDIQEAYDKMLERDYGYAEELIEDVLAELKRRGEKEVIGKELNVEANMAISGGAARLAFRYCQTIEDEEHPYEAQNKGFTPRELGLRRTRAHDLLMAQLIREGYTFKYRGDVTVWAEQVVKWIRDE